MKRAGCAASKRGMRIANLLLSGLLALLLAPLAAAGGQEAEERESRDENVDEMYDRAIAIVAETRNASISYIQRRLKVGYNRAARMIEQMEADGIVGPQEGTKPREVYVSAIEP